MPLLRNPKHERFAQEIANGRSLVDAYKAAGFKPDFRNAKRLRDRKDIGQRVDQILTDRERRATLSTERAIEKAAITKADVITEQGRPGEFDGLNREEMEQHLVDELVAGGIPEKTARAFIRARSPQ